MSKRSRLMAVCAMTTIVATMNTIPAFAKVVSYVTEENQIKYEYTQDDLINSMITGTGAYKKYLSQKLVAVKDDVRGYIDSEDVVDAMINSSISGEKFDIDQYTQSQDSKLSVITENDVKKVDSEGNTEGDVVTPEDFEVVEIK